MVVRYCGKLRVHIVYTGPLDEDNSLYEGAVITQDGRRWEFNRLCVHVPGPSDKNLDIAAAEAFRYACYGISTHNAPSRELMAVFTREAEREHGFIIRRDPRNRLPAYEG